MNIKNVISLRKIFALALVFLLIFTIVPGLSVCGFAEGEGDGEEETCEHEVDNWSTYRNSTCTYNGIMVGTCTKCGETCYRSLPLLEHTWGETLVIKNATCTSEGLEERTCSVCGLKEETVIPIADHTWSSWSTVSEPSSTSGRVEERDCLVCGEHEERTLESTLKLSFVSAASNEALTSGEDVDINLKLENIGESPVTVLSCLSRGEDGEFYPEDSLSIISNAITIAPGASTNLTLIIKVQDSDLSLETAVRYLTVNAIVNADAEDTAYVASESAYSNTIGIAVPVTGGSPYGINADDLDDKLYLHSTLISTIPDAGFSQGSSLLFCATLVNFSDSWLSDLFLYESSDPDAPLACVSLAPNETRTLYFTRIVSESDCEAGFLSGYIYTEVMGIGGNGNFCSEHLTIPAGTGSDELPFTADLVYISTPVSSSGYAVGEALERCVTFANTGSKDIINVTVFDIRTGIVGEFPTIEAGESVSIPCSLTVSEADAMNGFLTDALIINAEQESKKLSLLLPGESIPTISPISVPVVSQVEKSSPSNGVYYGENESVSFVFTVTNPSDHTVEDIELYNTLVKATDPVEVFSLAAGESYTYEYSRLVGSFYSEEGTMSSRSMIQFTDGKASYISQSNSVTVLTAEPVKEPEPEPAATPQDISSSSETGSAAIIKYLPYICVGLVLVVLIVLLFVTKHKKKAAEQAAEVATETVTYTAGSHKLLINSKPDSSEKKPDNSDKASE